MALVSTMTMTFILRKQSYRTLYYRIFVIITRPLIKPVSLILPEFSAINKFIISEMGKFH